MALRKFHSHESRVTSREQSRVASNESRVTSRSYMMKSVRVFVSGRHAIAVVTAGACLLIGTVTSLAQAPARGATPPGGRSGSPPASGRGAAAQKADANLAQLMRGIVYPSSNVVFAAQSDLNFPPVKDPATSPNLLTST